MLLTRTLAACLACLLAGLAIGRHTVTPARETSHEVASEEIVIAEDETLASEQLASYAATETATEREEAAIERVRIVYRERIVQADGATEEREMEMDAETAHLLREAESHREEVASLRAQLAAQRSGEALIRATLDLRRQLIPARPDWRISGMIGLDLRDGLPTYGAAVERRILGPISVGAWGLSSGAVGASVGVAW